MDPRHLVQLATILELGSLSRASRTLHLTQPTLTHNMQTLEMQAGGRLFERGRFGVRSTPLGELFAREGRAIGRRLKDADELSARHRHGLHHTIRIGTGPLVGAAFMPDLALHLLRHFPNLALTVQSDRPHMLLEQMIDGSHDVVIAPSWLDKPPSGIERFLLMQDAIGVFCGAGHPLAARGTLGPGLADAMGWISLGTTSPFDQDVRDMLKEVGIEMPRTEISLLGEASMLLQTLAQGRHLAVLPCQPVRRLQPQFPIVELALSARPRARPIYLWCRATLLEDVNFARIKETIIGFAPFRQARERGTEAVEPAAVQLAPRSG